MAALDVRNGEPRIIIRPTGSSGNSTISLLSFGEGKAINQKKYYIYNNPVIAGFITVKIA